MKLSPKDIQAIQHRLDTTSDTLRALASEYGVSAQTIYNIKRGHFSMSYRTRKPKPPKHPKPRGRPRLSTQSRSPDVSYNPALSGFQKSPLAELPGYTSVSWQTQGWACLCTKDDKQMQGTFTTGYATRKLAIDESVRRLQKKIALQRVVY